MGLLVGLPLKLFHLLFVVLRLVWPLLLAWLVVRIVRRRGKAAKENSQEPQFHGPVYTVDYEEVDPDK